MNKRATWIAVAVVAGVVGVGELGCRRAETPPPVVSTATRGPHVEAGTKFGGTLRSELSTLRSRAGDKFTVTVEEDVRKTDGTVAIRAGEVLHGRVARVRGDNETPTLSIAFEGISVAVIDADGYATVGLADPTGPDDSVFSPPIGPKAAYGGGPRSFEGDNAIAPRRELTLPAGTKLLLLVTEPIVR